MANMANVGIDFGTTNSAATRFEPNRAQYDNPFTDCFEDERPIPSVVAIDRVTSEVHTGIDAWRERQKLAETCECITSVKSVLDDASWSKRIAGREWFAPDVACEVFLKLRQVAEEVNVDLSAATLAVPVGMKPKARSALRKAALYAGINVRAFVSEPTAAFFAYYDELKSAERIAVFDWGGGTLDVSILHHSRGNVTELATAGMNIAGDNIDRELAGRIHARHARRVGSDIEFEEVDANSRDRLLNACEEAKRELSSEPEAELVVTQYGDLGTIIETVYYDEFEDLITPIVNKAIKRLDKAIAESGSSDAGIDRVLMVGGTSNLPQIRSYMEQRFGERLLFSGDDGFCVSRGASRLSYAPGTYVAAQNVSIILADGTPYYLLRKGERISGWKHNVEFGITDASQTLRVIFSGSSDIDSDEERIRLVRVPSYGFLEEKLVLEAEIDSDFIFRVRMKSSMRPRGTTQVWEYDRLKLAYGIGD